MEVLLSDNPNIDLTKSMKHKYRDIRKWFLTFFQWELPPRSKCFNVMWLTVMKNTVKQANIRIKEHLINNTL